jgi:hypothetical protein
MLGKIRNLAPRVFLHWRIVDEDWEAMGTVWDDFIFDVEPSGVPVYCP